MKFVTAAFPLSLLISLNCGSNSSTDPGNVDPTVESAISDYLDDYCGYTDFTLYLRSSTGHNFIYTKGNSSEEYSYESASTSKMVTAAVILNLVNEGVLSLDDHPQDFISFWPDTGNLGQIQLRHLLNFTSGLENAPFSLNYPNYPFEDVVQDILDENPDPPVPGTEFYYSSSHLQVAGLMAIEASGLGTWENVFDSFKTETGLFPTSVYDLPSITNPRLAGGMHWKAVEYIDFLEALHNEDILSHDLITQMQSDQLDEAEVAYSPVIESIGLDWHYGFGDWIECDANPFDVSCVTGRISSPGAYGAYPFIDNELDYIGILARQGSLGTFSEGYEIIASIDSLLQEWAATYSPLVQLKPDFNEEHRLLLE